MKNKFIEIYNAHITRPGADKLLKYLEKSDFFTAPASTRFHLSKEGGLVEHSINVFERLKQLCEAEEYGKQSFAVPTMETIAICGLLHDVCKCDFYKTEIRNKKNPETGAWEQVPVYTVDDQMPFGHGEKSVYIINSFMRLTREEAMAIRWHMGFSDSEFKAGGYGVSNAFEKYPLAVVTHLADLQATYLDESNRNKP